MIVCVNKMDDSSVGYKEARYNEIKEEVSAYLKKVSKRRIVMDWWVKVEWSKWS